MKPGRLFKPIELRPLALAAVAVISLGSVALSQVLRPSKYWADHTGEPHYETMIPRQFGNWMEVPYGKGLVVDPVQEENLKRIYSETFARTFVDRRSGRAIMLSIAYGRDQSNDTQLHTPDQCYPSQGFRVDENRAEDIATAFGTIKATRLKTSLGTDRQEPLTFFIRVGEGIARGSKERNLERIKLAMKGYRVDGMLLRVSEVTRRGDTFALQDRFIAELLQALPARDRAYLIGTLGG